MYAMLANLTGDQPMPSFANLMMGLGGAPAFALLPTGVLMTDGEVDLLRGDTGIDLLIIDGDNVIGLKSEDIPV